MRLALLSDIHANARALRACLAHARAQGATQLAFLGDLVGYGAEPGEVVDLVRALAAEGAIVLKGNHDELAVLGVDDGTRGGQGAVWTHGQLDDTQRAYLAQLPLSARAGDNLLVHASADAPAQWHYVNQAIRAARSLDAACAQEGVRRVFGGHVHEQRLWFMGSRGGLMPFTPTPAIAVPLPAHRRWLATIGSVGQPRDGDTRAAYALFEDDPEPRLTFWRVTYDHGAAAQAIARSGLPPDFARRLMEGR